MTSGRILGIDYGQKRIGLAVSDPSGIIANGLETIPSGQVWTFLEDYLSKENVIQFVVGFPRKMNYDPSESVRFINPFIRKLKEKYSSIPVELVDERYTSKMAVQTMINGGLKKKARQDKALVDKISATIILQSFLDQRSSLKERHNQ